jgi:hypothetical protein
MTKEIETKVLNIARNNLEHMTKDYGIQPTLRDDDLKSYVEEVILELQSSGKKSKESSESQQ